MMALLVWALDFASALAVVVVAGFGCCWLNRLVVAVVHFFDLVVGPRLIIMISNPAHSLFAVLLLGLAACSQTVVLMVHWWLSGGKSRHLQ